MDNHIKYQNPPLVEAVFELYFKTEKWNGIVPGKFYEFIKDEFPIISQSPSGFGISFDANGFRIGNDNVELIQFKNNSSNTIIQLTNRFISVNKLPNYDGWENYLKVILYAFDNIKKVLDDIRIERIGLKTINKIDIQDHSVEKLKEFFNVYPQLPVFNDDGCSDVFSSFNINLETPISSNDEVFSLTIASIKPDENLKAPVFFQLYVTRLKNVSNDVKEWVEYAHLKLKKVFESALTTTCKNRFNNVSN